MARILLAEDDEGGRSFAARALERERHVVDAVADGLAALDALGRERYDLLIADIVMPGLDGVALALKVARDRPTLPVLLITGYASERRRAHNLEELICGVLTKPFTLQALCRAAESALADGPAARRGAARPAPQP